MIVDVHTHVIPRFLIERAMSGETDGIGVTWERDGLKHHLGYWYPVPPVFHDSAEKLADMDRKGIDFSVVSVSPTLFCYDKPIEVAEDLSREINDSIAAFVAKAPDSFAGLATVPLQEPDAAVIELHRAKEELGLLGVQIGTNVEQTQLDDAEVRPFFAAAQQLEMPVTLHPYYVGSKRGLEPYYLTNSVGNPLDTCIAIARLIHGGIPERFPSLRFIAVHGGGFFPFQVGRFDHAWRVREEPRANIGSPPSAYLKPFYFDTVTHDRMALRFLLELVGRESILLGSDIPFDMAEENPVGRVREVLEPHAIGGNAMRLYGLG
jgi:aminocarboxymuconate-semialdehyde decarboxylase